VSKKKSTLTKKKSTFSKRKAGGRQKKNVLITGVTGTVGSRLAEASIMIRG